MAPPRQGAKRANAAADTGARDTAAFFNKLAPNIIDPNIQIRFKSLINRDNKKDACTLRDPRLGLTLLQIAVLADNVSAVEQLIALGADVKVTFSQQHAYKWTPQDAPCRLSQRGGESFWDFKMRNLCLMQTAPESIRDTLFGLIHLAVLGGSLASVRFLVENGHAHVNAAAAKSGLTPLMCAALCNQGPNRESCRLEPMLNMAKLLLELGGDLSRVNVVGNDFVAIAASTWDRGLWEEILNDPVLLAKCTAKHAGRVALQLFATWVCDKYRPNQDAKDHIAKTWCAAMTKMSSAWASAAGAKADTDEYKERFARELSEPVKQRILRPDKNNSDANSHAYLCFWPDEEHVTTNVLTAIMQGIGVPPHQVKLSMLEARRMLILLFKMGVKPEALLLPRHPDRGNPRMCCLEGLQALIDVFVERSNYGDISKHKEVFMDQLWCYFCTRAKHPTMDLVNAPTQMDTRHVRQLLSELHKHGVDWTDPSFWPEDYVGTKWERQIPIPFLLENMGGYRTGSIRIIVAISEELQRLGNRDFVNTYDPDKTPPMIYAAREGHGVAIIHMIACNGSPDRQGSNWAEFFMAATSNFNPDIATTIHSMMGIQSALPRIRASCSRVQLEQCQGEGHKLTQSFIRHLAGNHSGFEALLLPLVSDPCAQMLYQQCQLALKAPKNDMRLVLETLLSPNRCRNAVQAYRDHIQSALSTPDPKSGVTLLGQAVAWGYDQALTPILHAISEPGKDLASLLDCYVEKSKFHKPLFAAVVYGYDNMLHQLLERMDLRGRLPSALLEHVVLERTGGGSSGSLSDQSRLFVKEPGPGVESVDLLMCAASAGSSGLTKLLIDCGMKPQDTMLFRKNRYYKSAMHAAVQYPDLAMLMWEGSESVPDGMDGMVDLLPGTKQMRCVETLLKAGAAMTMEQLTVVIHALPTLQDPKVARSTWRLLTKHVSECAGCGELGCWSCCHRCMTTSYCSVRCQKKDWLKHKATCWPIETTTEVSSKHDRLAVKELLMRKKGSNNIQELSRRLGKNTRR